jgi:hypothetical protein
MMAAVTILLFGFSAPVQSQIADHVLIVGRDVVLKEVVARYDRKLHLLGETLLANEGSLGSVDITTQLVPDANGVYWLNFDTADVTKLLRISPDGQLLPSAVIGHNPVGVGMTQQGTVYALTKLLFNGPLYRVSNEGSIVWSNLAIPSMYTGDYPDHVGVTSTGKVFIGGNWKGTSGLQFLHGLIVGVDPDTGSAKSQQEFLQSESIADLVGSIDGKLWTLAYSSGVYLTKTDGRQTLQSDPVLGGNNGQTLQIRVNGEGDVWLVSPNNEEGADGTHIRLFSQLDGSLLSEHDMGGAVIGFALGASGDEVFAVMAVLQAPDFPRRLVRTNLVTGVRSTAPLTGQFGTSIYMCNGDPTGFHFANVIDQAGDNDGDGYSNRTETAARTNPFDPLSRPVGPKVFISFAQSNNAIILKFVDPDGLLDPVGGLSIPSISVHLGPYGEVFNYLLPFLTFVQVSPDLTEATALFGALPLASDKKWELEASVTDKSGARGWDWQVTPPGDL